MLFLQKIQFQIIFLFGLISSGSCALTIIRDLVQFNLAGPPLIHKDSTWNFDPDVGIRRSRQYQEINGKFGEKAIERLGLGIDGYDKERLVQQRFRDDGHLNGASS